MKCEQHGVEMEWRGSLSAGRMYCEQCASTGGRSYADIAKELLGGFDVAAPGTTDKTGKSIADAYSQSIQGTFNIGANPNGKIVSKPRSPARYAIARANVRDANEMQRKHRVGQPAWCPYCMRITSPDHTLNNADGGGDCCGKYFADNDYLTRNKP